MRRLCEWVLVTILLLGFVVEGRAASVVSPAIRQEGITTMKVLLAARQFHSETKNIFQLEMDLKNRLQALLEEKKRKKDQCKKKVCDESIFAAMKNLRAVLESYYAAYIAVTDRGLMLAKFMNMDAEMMQKVADQLGNAMKLNILATSLDAATEIFNGVTGVVGAYQKMSSLRGHRFSSLNKSQSAAMETLESTLEGFLEGKRFTKAAWDAVQQKMAGIVGENAGSLGGDLAESLASDLAEETVSQLKEFREKIAEARKAGKTPEQLAEMEQNFKTDLKTALASKAVEVLATYTIQKATGSLRNMSQETLKLLQKIWGESARDFQFLLPFIRPMLEMQDNIEADTRKLLRGYADLARLFNELCGAHADVPEFDFKPDSYGYRRSKKQYFGGYERLPNGRLHRLRGSFSLPKRLRRKLKEVALPVLNIYGAMHQRDLSLSRVMNNMPLMHLEDIESTDPSCRKKKRGLTSREKMQLFEEYLSRHRREEIGAYVHVARVEGQGWAPLVPAAVAETSAIRKGAARGAVALPGGGTTTPGGGGGPAAYIPNRTYTGDGGCGLNTMTVLSNTATQFVAQVPGNGTVTFTGTGQGCPACLYSASNLTVFGIPGHQATIDLTPPANFAFSASNPAGGSCVEFFR